jgi:hypothetical protein
MEDTDRSTTTYDADFLANTTKRESYQHDIENSVLVKDLTSQDVPVQSLPKVLDHFSLSSNSSAIKFKTAYVNVYS